MSLAINATQSRGRRLLWSAQTIAPCISPIREADLDLSGAEGPLGVASRPRWSPRKVRRSHPLNAHLLLRSFRGLRARYRDGESTVRNVRVCYLAAAMARSDQDRSRKRRAYHMREAFQEGIAATASAGDKSVTPPWTNGRFRFSLWGHERRQWGAERPQLAESANRAGPGRSVEEVPW